MRWPSTAETSPMEMRIATDVFVTSVAVGKFLPYFLGQPLARLRKKSCEAGNAPRKNNTVRAPRCTIRAGIFSHRALSVGGLWADARWRAERWRGAHHRRPAPMGQSR